MKNAILIHGCCDKQEFFSDEYPSGSNSHWFPWLQKQLIKQGIETQTPEMPTPFAPKYEEWVKVMDQFQVMDETILVGHSCGAGFLVRYLTDTKLKADKLILVAPYLDPIKKRKGFLDFEIDPTVQDKVNELHILFSTDESVEGVKESTDTVAEIFPKAQVHKFNNKGHFTFEEMKTVEFPELLELIIK